MRRYLTLPAVLLLTACGTAVPTSAPEPTTVAEPSPTTTQDPTPEPAPEPVAPPQPATPIPDSSPAPTDAPPLLDTTAVVRNLSTIDPEIAYAHGLLPTAYYPLVHNPALYCSVEDITVCGTENEIMAAFSEWVTPELDAIQEGNEARMADEYGIPAPAETPTTVDDFDPEDPTTWQGVDENGNNWAAIPPPPPHVTYNGE